MSSAPVSEKALASGAKVFAGITPMPPDGKGDAYFHVVMEQLLGDIWARPGLSI